ncbi:hypothetical protein DRQ33_02890 [bacterium]|nr:MAG: hypothetical protein DRQ33_02890 [bacterium]
MAKPTKKFASSTALAGILTGLLSSIPFLAGFNCCCLWFLLGGFWAVYLIWYENHHITVGLGIGAGLITGVYSAIIYSILNAVLLAFTSSDTIIQLQELFSQGQQEIPPEFMDLLVKFITSPVISFFFFLIFSLLIFPIATGVGGLIGALIFKNKENKQPKLASEQIDSL